MARIFFTILLPLLLPTIVYVGWAAAGARAQPDRDWRRVPWLYLAAAGVVLVVATLASLTLHFGDPTGGVYVPAQLKDGEVVPGHFAPDPGRS